MLRQGDGGVFESRLSGDIHPAASLMFYILTGGAHAFGEDYREQQTNVMKGRPVNLRRLADNPAACDLFLRMTSVEPKLRLTIEQACAVVFCDCAPPVVCWLSCLAHHVARAGAAAPGALGR